jgi:hypothetical protein
MILHILSRSEMADHQRHSTWREKRQARGRQYDPTKKAKADMERFRRGKMALAKKGNQLYQDGRDVGRERRVYICVFQKSKYRDTQGEYFVYNSHSNESWPPGKEEVVGTFARSIKELNADKN